MWTVIFFGPLDFLPLRGFVGGGGGGTPEFKVCSIPTPPAVGIIVIAEAPLRPDNKSTRCGEFGGVTILPCALKELVNGA